MPVKKLATGRECIIFVLHLNLSNHPTRCLYEHDIFKFIFTSKFSNLQSFLIISINTYVNFMFSTVY